MLSYTQEGILPAATNLSKLDDEDSMRACATVFALLSANPLGRARFVERKSALVSLFDLLRSKDQGTQVICGKVTKVRCVSIRVYFSRLEGQPLRSKSFSGCHKDEGTHTHFRQASPSASIFNEISRFASCNALVKCK